MAQHRRAYKRSAGNDPSQMKEIRQAVTIRLADRGAADGRSHTSFRRQGHVDLRAEIRQTIVTKRSLGLVRAMGLGELLRPSFNAGR
jgi:hypothetical protein